MVFKRRDNRLTGLNPLAYVGVEPVSPPGLDQVNRAPTINDLNFDIGHIWIDSVTQVIWMLVDTGYNIAFGSRIATWVPLTGGAPATPTSLVTDDSALVAPVAGIINLHATGAPYLTTTGAGNTASVNFDVSGLVTQLTADDANVATPLGGNINISGGLSVISTRVLAPHTLEIDLDDGGAGQVIIGSGGFGAPVWANLASADGTVTITNGANTIDLSVSAVGQSSIKVTDYDVADSPAVWTKDPRSKWITIYGWAGGTGGASGRQGASGLASGGEGGSGGGSFMFSSPAVFFGVTENVIVGAGGHGGIPQVNANTNGLPGQLGGTTSFGYITYINHVVSQGGKSYENGSTATKTGEYSVVNYSAPTPNVYNGSYTPTTSPETPSPGFNAQTHVII